MKKFLSKRGFTIIEVMVAFVIFAIMAGMISVILNTMLSMRRENNVLEDEIKEQKEKYYLNTQDKTYSSKDGTLQFKFDGVSSDVMIDYSVGDPNEESDDNQVALDYFIGDVNYNSLFGDNKKQDDDDSKGSTIERLDSRIYGTSGIDSLTIKVEDLGSVEGGYRYKFSVLATSSTLVGSQYEYHAQYKIVMPSTIVDYGYVGGSGTLESKKSGYNKEIKLSLPRTNSICVGSRMPQGYWEYNSNKDNYKSMFAKPSYKSFWVTLSSKMDVSDLNKIFGTSGTKQTSNKNGDKYVFTPYVETQYDDKGNETGTVTHVNIFGAFPKDTTPEDSDTEEASTTEES